jgi:hypothetical protein
VGCGLFLLALVLRLLFLWATPDAGWPHSAWYKGDAATWLEWAQALEESETFEADLPIRPPGTAYLIAALWSGDPEGITRLKVVWCLIGALTVVPLYLAARRPFGAGVALVIGLLCAGSTGLMVLSTSLNNETPYLFLVAMSIYLAELLRKEPRPGYLVLWAFLGALACLTRAEHILYFVLVLSFLQMRWMKVGVERAPSLRRWLQTLTLAGLAVAVFCATLLPWHLAAWSQIRRFNGGSQRVDARTEEAQSRLEQLLAEVSWSSEALAELERMPAATRRTMRLFISATEAIRGRRAVSAESVEILDEAFGYRPQPLPSHPYVALYGSLNFYLANNPRATTGFSRAVLEQPPPLSAGAGRYPLALVEGLPPRQLTLTYPPHLEVVNEGYRLGWTWIRDNPGEFALRAGRKLQVLWRGAALGLGGYNLPLGLSGNRPQVDLLVPDGGAATASWRGGLLILVLTGAWMSRRNPATIPWLALLVTKVIVTVAFFGYARHGATVIPMVALLACLASAEVLARTRNVPRRWQWGLATGAALLLLAVEVGRFAYRPEVTIDGQRIGEEAPFVAHDHHDRRVDVD